MTRKKNAFLCPGAETQPASPTGVFFSFTAKHTHSCIAVHRHSCKPEISPSLVVSAALRGAEEVLGMKPSSRT